MKNPFLRWTVLFAFALTLMTVAATESRVYAQGPGPCPINPYSSNRNIREIAFQILTLQLQGATVTCEDYNVYVHFPNGQFFSFSAPNGLPIYMYSFDPVTGRTTHWYVLYGSNLSDAPTLLIQDSVYGLINVGDGWTSLFYPIGNPFSASIQNPFEAMMMGWHAPFPDPWGINEPPPRPRPIQQ